MNFSVSMHSRNPMISAFKAPVDLSDLEVAFHAGASGAPSDLLSDFFAQVKAFFFGKTVQYEAGISMKEIGRQFYLYSNPEATEADKVSAQIHAFQEIKNLVRMVNGGDVKEFESLMRVLGQIFALGANESAVVSEHSIQPAPEPLPRSIDMPPAVAPQQPKPERAHVRAPELPPTINRSAKTKSSLPPESDWAKEARNRIEKVQHREIGSNPKKLNFAPVHPNPFEAAQKETEKLTENVDIENQKLVDKWGPILDKIKEDEIESARDMQLMARRTDAYFAALAAKKSC